MTAQHLGWPGVIAVMVIIAACVPLSLDNFDWVPVLLLGLWLFTTTVVGALIVSARPGHPVGLLMMAAGIAVAFTSLFVYSYATYSFYSGRDLPLERLAAWATLWTTIPSFTLFIHLLLRFPSGDLPSPWWRWVSRLVVACAVFTSVGYAFRRGPIDSIPELDNPAGPVFPPLLSDIGIAVGDTLLPLVATLAVVSLIFRYRKARPRERQQMKWFILSVSLFPVLFLVSQLVQFADDSEEEYLGFFLIVVALLAVPVSMGVGILKHRLYDVDVVLNRALVYGALTGILAAAYLGLVVLLQQLVGSFTRGSDLVVAGSTLAVAALFRPLRGRVQAFIDRRFYRRKYDAAATLGEFSSHLRDQVDLASLNHELVGVVARTMQPAHASLWLRDGASR